MYILNSLSDISFAILSLDFIDVASRFVWDTFFPCFLILLMYLPLQEYKSEVLHFPPYRLIVSLQVSNNLLPSLQ